MIATSEVLSPPPRALEPSITLHDSIRDVVRSEWDALAGDDVLASHGWLATMERTRCGGAAPLYVVARAAGRIVGGAAVVRMHATDAIETVDHVLLGRFRPLAARIGISFLPALVAAPLRGFGCLPLASRELDEGARGRVLDAILDAIEDEAARRGVALFLGDLRPCRADLAARLAARGFVDALDDPVSVLDVRWDSFDAYLRHLDRVSRGARKDVRRQQNQNRKRGTTITAEDDAGREGDRLWGLMTMNERAHNRRPFGFAREFFAVLASELAGDAVVYAARKEGRITATSLLLRRGTTGYLPMVGVDHAAAGRDFTFFAIAHYRPIGDAIADGLRTLHFGRALDGLKARRGCRLEETRVFYRASARLGRRASRVWLGVLSTWNRVKRA
jgi:predicted N-acyltransferase